MNPQPRYASPLRYPGGKARMAGFLAELYAGHFGPMGVEIWAEPFAGGAGAGLSLLHARQVGEVWLTEANPALAAFWRAAITLGEELAAAVETATADMALWNQSQEVLQAVSDGQRPGDLEVGMAAFVVNRCSRSGIVSHLVGTIGGKHQAGRWTVQARWNGPALAERIRQVGRLGDSGRLRVNEGDGIAAIIDLNDSGLGDEVMLFVDPPYIREGNRLYANGMTLEQHRQLAQALNVCQSPWILTYDNEPVVAETLYPERRVLAYNIANTANRQRIAQEYAVFSDNLAVPEEADPVGRGGTWIREA